MTQCINNVDIPESLHAIGAHQTGVTGVIELHSTIRGPGPGGRRF